LRGFSWKTGVSCALIFNERNANKKQQQNVPIIFFVMINGLMVAPGEFTAKNSSLREEKAAAIDRIC
jgi:hypothetical protein